MSQHYTTNTKQVLHYCPTCGRQTMHRVDYKRLGSCTEHGAAAGMSRKQIERQEQREIEAQQQKLF